MPKKTEEYIAEGEHLAALAKAMGHPARIAILKHLASVESCFFGQIKLPLSNATISQHLSELKLAGLIDSKVETPKVRYMINRENWESARAAFDSFFDKISNSAGVAESADPKSNGSENSRSDNHFQASGWIF